MRAAGSATALPPRPTARRCFLQPPRMFVRCGEKREGKGGARGWMEGWRDEGIRGMEGGMEDGRERARVTLNAVSYSSIATTN
eukprot:2265039-Rhodomonas_salina.1